MHESIKTIQVPGIPAPGGHYAHAIAHGGWLHVSGQLGRWAGMSDEEAGDIRAQTRRALSSIDAIVRAAGTDMSHIVKMNVYIADVVLWPDANAEYADYLGEHRPARAIIPTGILHHGALVEIDAIAVIDPSGAGERSF